MDWRVLKANADTEREHLNKILAEIQAATSGGGVGSSINLPEIAEPSTPAADTATLYVTDRNGLTELELKDSTGLVHRIGEELLTRVRNTSGTTLNVGEAIYITGSTGTIPNVARARADSESTTPCAGLVLESIANNSFGRVIFKGILAGFDTSSFTEGDAVYLSPSTAGGLTTTRPSHPNFIQKLGVITNSGVGNGSMLVNVDAIVRPFAPTVVNGDTSFAPTGDAVFDAIAAAGSGWTYLKLGSDFSTTSTSAAVTGMDFTPDASSTYEVEALMLVTTSLATVGPRPGVDWAVGTSYGAAMFTGPNSATTFATLNSSASTNGVVASTGLPSAGQEYLATMKGLFVTSGVVGSTFGLLLGTETAGTSVTMKAGSFLKYRTI